MSVSFEEYIESLPPDEQEAVRKGGDEKVYAMVLQILLKCGRPSASYLQRQMKWPYPQCVRWVERICERVPTKQWDENELPWFDFEEIAKRLRAHE